MKSWISILKFFLLIFLPINFFAYRITSYKGYKVVDGELLVKFKAAPSLDILNKFKVKHALKHIDSRNFKNWYIAKFDLPIEEQLEAIKNDPLVEYVEPNYIFTIFFSSTNDPYYNEQKRYFDQIKLPPAWELYSQHRSSPVIVAVLDTGVDAEHPDLKENIEISLSTGVFPNVSPPYRDDHYEPRTGKHSHGTHVSGIIAAVVNNSSGVAGICPKVKLIAVKVMDHEGKGDSAGIGSGIQYAVNVGAKIINLSLGLEVGQPLPKELKDRLDDAYGRGCLIVAAAGNDGVSQLAYPAAHPKVLSVGSVNKDDRKSVFSNYGKNLDIMAPGEGIWSTYRSDLQHRGIPLYGPMMGTSMSAPIVSGIAAILLSLRPELSVYDLENIIVKITADDIGEPDYDTTTGHGRVNAFNAVHYLFTRQERAIVRSISFPNPFIIPDRRFIVFQVPKEISGANLEITIFNFAGETITKIEEPIWYGKDDGGEYIPSGLYFYRLKTDRGSSTGKFTVIKK